MVFRWRGARKHHMGKFLALAIAVAIFAFAIPAVQLEELKTPVVSQSTASVIYIDEDSPLSRELVMQIWDKSPFPPRWDPAQDPETLQRVLATSDAISPRVHSYSPTLVPMPISTENDNLPSTVNPNAPLLPSRAAFWKSIAQSNDETTAPEAVQAMFVMNTSAALRERLPKNMTLPPAHLVTEEWLGQTFRFILTLTPRGTVGSVFPVQGGTLDEGQLSESQKALLTWIKAQHFTPHTSASTGTIELQLKAIQP